MRADRRTGGQANRRTGGQADRRAGGQAGRRAGGQRARYALLCGALLLTGCAAQPTPVAPSAGPPVRLPALLSTDQLAEWQRRGDSLRLIDVRTDPFTYLKGHLPEAVYLNTETLRAAEGGTPLQLFTGQWYAQVFARLGVRWDRPVVVYSAGETHNIDATFVAWLLAGYGHPRVFLLDGGYFKWELEQRPIAKHYPKLAASPPPPRAFRPAIATLDDVRRAVERHDAVLVDARPPDQFSGEAGAQMRRGHIPGAINHYWQDDLGQEGFGRVWKPVQELRSSYAEQGITPDQRIILYCNSTTEASHVFFALSYLLGYPDVRIYTGAWTEWAERIELPIEGGQAGRRAGGQ
jgi:thiosulfate/3-mercaptopyruvate sulfurtransferase